MKASMSMWSLDRAVCDGRIDQSAFLDFAQKENLKYVELLSYYMEQEGRLSAVKKRLDRDNLTVSCYTILTDFTDPDQAEDADFLRDLEAARSLGAPYVRVLAGDAEWSEEGEKLLIEGLKRGANRAAELGLTLVLENVGSFLYSSEQLCRIVTSVGSANLKINFDMANPLLYDEDPLESFAILADHVVYVHFKDFVTADKPEFEPLAARDRGRIQSSRSGQKMTGVVTGQGEVDIPKLMEMLKKRGYDGFVSLEYEGTGDSLADSRESLGQMRALL